MTVRRQLVVVMVAGLLAAAPAAAKAQQPETNLWKDELVPCNQAIAGSERLNGPQLFRSAADCVKQDRAFDALFLQVAGQIRSQTDMQLLRPLGDLDRIATSQLYTALFQRLGGSGPRDLYTDAARIDQMFEQLEAWQPDFFPNYSPGWNYRPSDHHAHYATLVGEVTQRRLAQLRDYAVLARNPRYVTLEAEAKEIQARHPRGIPVDSEDYGRFQQLYKELNTIAQESASHQRALKGRSSSLASLPQELGEGVTQLFTGLNGPAKPGSHTFTTKEEVSRSWLARALTKDQLRDVLAQVNFEEQVLVTIYFGQRTTATGTVYISDVSYSTLEQRWSVAGRVGVRDNSCPKMEATSFPFALAVAPRPADTPLNFSQSRQNFGDGCKPPTTGEPTLLD